jgi:hypothetical protein
MTFPIAWIGLSRWWCQMDSAGQAAWFQAIASILALVVAIYIPYVQRRIEEKDRRSDHRRRSISAAAVLDTELAYESAVLNFAPLGDGVIGHEFTLSQAERFMKLRPEARSAIHSAIEKAHYFPDDLCEQIVRLGIEASAYDRIIEDAARRTPAREVDEFFESCIFETKKLQHRMDRVRDMLKSHLPQE